MNFIKWLGAIAGFVLESFLYFKWLKNYSWNFLIFKVEYFIGLLFISCFIYVFDNGEANLSDNQVIKIVVDLWSGFLSGH